LAVVLAEDGEIVVLLFVYDRGFCVQQFQVVGGPIEDVVVISCAAVFNKGVHLEAEYDQIKYYFGLLRIIK
jgi:hypothetical protein